MNDATTQQRHGCPDEGTLRAFHDHQAPNHAAIAQHVRECLTCARTMREVRANAALASSRIGLLDDAAPQAVQPAVVALDPPMRRRGPRRLAAAGTAAAVGAVLVVTPVGQSVAKNVLEAFRSKEVVAVEVTTADAQQTALVLGQLGTAPTESAEPALRQVASVQAAQQLVPFRVAQPAAADLPAGVNATPEVTVSDGHDAQFVFSAARTRAYLKQQGSNLAVPDGLDGERLTISVPSAVALNYSGIGGKRLVVGTAEPVGARAEGAMSLAQLRDFLLQVPGVPKSVTNQLGDVDPLRGSLPIPVPVDVVKGEDATVAGHQAVQMSQQGLGAGLVWAEDSRLVGVAGSYDEKVIATLAAAVAQP